MSKREELEGLNESLADQVRRLVKAEQRLSWSQRELSRQKRRVDALNQMVLRAMATPDPAAIFEAALRLLFAAFPYEQGLGLLSSPDGRLLAAASSAVAGREGGSTAGALRLRDLAPRVPQLSELVVDRVETILEASGPAADLVSLLLDVFEPTDRPSSMSGAILLLPLTTPSAPQNSVLVLRRTSDKISFHDAFPEDADRGFLDLVAQQVGVALTNAHLVASLKTSYEELARAQNELVTRERLAAIGQLAATVAHEIRNPLGSIINSVTMLERLTSDLPDAGELVGIVREEANRVNRIVTDLIEFARPGVVQKREQELLPIVAEAVDRAQGSARSHGVTIDVESTGNLRATFDDHMLRQATINLLDNAVAASPRGDTVRVRVGVGEDPLGAMVSVENKGAPIPAQAIGKIFEPFFTTKASGTGLGLAVVKRFADAHTGVVDVTSTPANGTVFTIRWQATL